MNTIFKGKGRTTVTKRQKKTANNRSRNQAAPNQLNGRFAPAEHMHQRVSESCKNTSRPSPRKVFSTKISPTYLTEFSEKIAQILKRLKCSQEEENFKLFFEHKVTRPPIKIEVLNWIPILQFPNSTLNGQRLCCIWTILEIFTPPPHTWGLKKLFFV